MPELADVLRTEQKYVINPVERARLEFVLGGALHRDRHGGLQGYMVRTLYFDTLDDQDFYDKVDGLEMRRKIRLRIYDPDARYAKLELKEKQGSLQRKRSLQLTREQALELCAGRYEVLMRMDTPFSLELYARMQQFCYRPKCIVEYNRAAFTAPDNETRVTLDAGLKASESRLDLFASDLALYPVGVPGAATMEVKFHGFLLSYVKDLISIPSRTRCSSSKYCMARNVILRDDL